MEKQRHWAEWMTEVQAAARAAQVDDEFIRRFNEAFDSAEQAKRENTRRLNLRLAELRAARQGTA